MKVVSVFACGIILLLACSLTYSEICRFTANNELDGIKRDHKNALADLRISKNKEINTLRRKLAQYDIVLDSIDTELTDKTKAINEIDKQSLALVGDSIGIINELKRVFADRN